MKIKKGDGFLCIRDVWMSSTKEIAYKKGNVYVSEYDDCITDEQGDKRHRWPDYEELMDCAAPYFRYLDAIASDKFHFKPFDKVLVRDDINGRWVATLYSHCKDYETSEYIYSCAGQNWKYCIPYEGNESLLGTPGNVKAETPDLPIDTPVMVADLSLSFMLRYYAGNKRFFGDGKRSVDSSATYGRTASFIIPFDKFDPNDIDKSLTFNILNP